MLNTIKKTMYIGLMLIQNSAYAENQEANREVNKEVNREINRNINRTTNREIKVKEAYAKEMYDTGKRSMQSKDWRDAIEAFKQAGKHSRLKEAAMYWQAYSHYQIKQKAQAKRLLERFD